MFASITRSPPAMRLAITLIALSALALASGTATAQSAPTKRLGQPTATHPAEFTRIASVRELSDGRVDLVDEQEQRVVRLDFKSGDATDLGRTGQGPGEYTMPLSLIALPGDSSALVDRRDGPTSVILTREGISKDALAVEGAAAGRTAFTFNSAADALGRIYYARRIIRTVDGKPVASDTNAIVRIDRRSGARDTVAFVDTRTRTTVPNDEGETIVGPGGTVMRMAAHSPIPFRSQDQFAVAPDGRVAVVSVEPYHVTFFDANGRRTAGPEIRFTPVRVDDAVKEMWRESAKRPQLSVMVTRGGGVSTRYAPPTYEEPEKWPEVLPSFVGNAVSFARDGNLWVHRATGPSSPPTYDVIDRTGRVSARVELPKERRLVGFGDGTIYLVRTDEDGLEYVERYALPR